MPVNPHQSLYLLPHFKRLLGEPPPPLAHPSGMSWCVTKWKMRWRRVYHQGLERRVYHQALEMVYHQALWRGVYDKALQTHDNLHGQCVA